MQPISLSLSWPWIGLGAAVVIFILLFFSDFLRVEKDKPRYKDLYWLACVFIIAYMLHNIEEFGIDLNGNALGFKSTMEGLFGTSISQSIVYIVNFSVVWITLPLTAYIAHKNKWKYMATGAAGFMLINGIGHIIATCIKGYNPGFLTAILLFIPLAIWTYYLMIKNGMEKKSVIINILIGIIYHIILIIPFLMYLKFGFNLVICDIIFLLDAILLFYLWYRFQKHYSK